ncbi:MAG: DinB family protein [Bacteroidia bacterium]|nr:DinB family protein [Bacteroidia bacterium]
MIRKKKFGYVLLALLVVSGFAGMEGTNTLTKEERKFATNHLKHTKNEFLKSLKGLSEAQLNFKTAPDKWSVKECAVHISLSEEALWQWIEATIKAPANPEKRSEIKLTDEQLLAGVTNRDTKVKTSESFEPKNAAWATLEEALTALKESRGKHIAYMKTTTEDLRNHVAMETPLGPLDAYQMVLLLSSHTNRHMQQINEVKQHPKFPDNK